jgi:hypothetical protein
MEQRLAVDDPDLASLLSTGMDEPDPPAPFSARRAPHGPPARTGGTATAMVIALVFLALLVLGAHALSPNASGHENEVQGPQCHAASLRDLDCQDLRQYAPGG